MGENSIDLFGVSLPAEKFFLPTVSQVLTAGAEATQVGFSNCLPSVSTDIFVYIESFVKLKIV